MDTGTEEYVQLRQLLRELVSTEQNASNWENFDQVSYIVKQVLQLGNEQAFLGQLNLYAAKKDFDVKKLCDANYQELVIAIDQLLKVKAGTSTMTEDTNTLRNQIKKSGKVIFEKKQEIVENRTILLNIEIALESLQSCLFLLDISNKIQMQIDGDRHYSALRILRELKDVHIELIASYGFSLELSIIHNFSTYQPIENSIPKLQNKIKNQVLNEMKDWLAVLKDNTKIYGKSALDNTLIKQDRVKTKISTVRQGNFSVNVNVGLEIAITEETDDYLEDTKKQIDFQPLYKCLLVHEFLGLKEELKIEYEEIRKLQSNLLLEGTIRFTNGDLNSFEMFLQEIIGFFIIESAILDSTENFRSRGIVEILWDTAIDKINKIIPDIMNRADNPDLYLSLKDFIVNFMRTAESFGFVIYKLRDSMTNLFDTFTELMKSNCANKIIAVIEDDDYEPMVISTIEELDKANEAFTLGDKISGTRLPTQLSCSKGVIQCCQLLKGFIIQFYRFSDGFVQQNNEIDDLLKKSVDSLIVQTINSSLSQKYYGVNLNQIVQIILNFGFFQMACSELENILSLNKTFHRGSKVVLHARDMLSNSMKFGDKQILESVSSNVSELILNSKLNWALIAHTYTTSAFAMDIAKYLSSNVSSAISLLKMDFRQVVFSQTCEAIGESSLSLLQHASIKRISTAALHVFHQDVIFLERSLIEQCPDIVLSNSFQELKQLLDFAKGDNFEEILNQPTRDKKYNLLKTPVVIAILEKMKPDLGLFATASEKIKKKSIDQVVKGLKLN